MNQPPSVSIIVTVYNRDKFLAACLESVLASTFTGFEVVVVDDGSSDTSVDIAESYRSRDSRIKVFRNEKNLGDYATRMRGAQLSTGRYLKYVDSDDIIYPHGLAVMVQAMEANPRAALGLSHSRPEESEPYPLLLEPIEAWRKEFLGDGCMGSGPTGAIIKRSVFERVGGFRDWGVLNDTDLWYRLSATAPIVLLAPALVWWRRHHDQEFTKNGAALVYLERGFNLTMNTLSSNDSPLSRTETACAMERARQHHARRIISLAVKRRMPGDALRILRNSGLSARDIARGFAPYR